MVPLILGEYFATNFLPLAFRHIVYYEWLSPGVARNMCYGHSVQSNQQFLIYRRQMDNFSCSSQSSLYSCVDTVNVLFNYLSQGLRDNTFFFFKDDSVLYGKFVSDIEVLGDFILVLSYRYRAIH